MYEPIDMHDTQKHAVHVNMFTTTLPRIYVGDAWGDLSRRSFIATALRPMSWSDLTAIPFHFFTKTVKSLMPKVCNLLTIITIWMRLVFFLMLPRAESFMF